MALDLLSERMVTGGAGLAEYTDTESDSTQNRLRAWPAGGGGEGRHRKNRLAPRGAGVRTACTADYSGDHADACYRPRHLGDTATADTTEYLPDRSTTEYVDDSRQTATDALYSDGICHALAEAGTNYLEVECDGPHEYSDNEYEWMNNNSTHNYQTLDPSINIPSPDAISVQCDIVHQIQQFKL